MDPRIRTEFAGHRIERVVGRGGASVVYAAEHLRLARKVALKVLAPHLADDHAFRERFIRESRVAAALDHPNIVTVFDAGEVEGNLFISMRYVEGTDLGRLLQAEGALEPSRAISIVGQIADALDAAHAQGLVHRDVKPANILVEGDPSTGSERAYLSDFGISKRTTSREGLTRTGQFVGTVDYVAPEQITGESVDARTDVYSLGCVLFECLAGRVPFPGETAVATIYSHLHDPPPALEGEEAAGIARVLQRALAKSMQERFPSCGDLVEAARTQLVAAAPTADRPPGRRGGRSGRLAMTLMAGAAAVVVAAVVLSQVLDTPPTDPADDPGRSTSPTDSVTPSPPGSEEDGDPPIRLSWIPAPYLGRVYEEAGRQEILDAVVLGDAVVGVGAAAPGGSIGKVADAAAWRSTNGRRWEVLRSPAFRGDGEQRMLSITQFRGRLVAAGWDRGDAGVWTSPDEGDTWIQSTSPALGGHGPQRIRALVPFDGDLVALGTTWGVDPDAAAWISSDGERWRRLDVGPPRSGAQDMRAGVVLGSSLVAVGLTEELGDTDPAVWVFEGGGWSQDDPNTVHEVGDQIMVDVAGGRDGLPVVAVGCEAPTERCDTSVVTDADAAVWISNDGRSWERVDAQGGGLTGEGRQVMRAVTVWDDRFVAVGSKEGLVDRDGAVWTSPDGTTWRAGGTLVSGLGGLGNQILRAVVVYERRRSALLGLGVTNQAEFMDGQVWIARPAGV